MDKVNPLTTEEPSGVCSECGGTIEVERMRMVRSRDVYNTEKDPNATTFEIIGQVAIYPHDCIACAKLSAEPDQAPVGESVQRISSKAPLIPLAGRTGRSSAPVDDGSYRESIMREGFAHLLYVRPFPVKKLKKMKRFARPKWEPITEPFTRPPRDRGSEYIATHKFPHADTSSLKVERDVDRDDRELASAQGYKPGRKVSASVNRGVVGHAEGTI